MYKLNIQTSDGHDDFNGDFLLDVPFLTSFDPIFWCQWSFFAVVGTYTSEGLEARRTKPWINRVYYLNKGFSRLIYHHLLIRMLEFAGQTPDNTFKPLLHSNRTLSQPNILQFHHLLSSSTSFPILPTPHHHLPVLPQLPSSLKVPPLLFWVKWAHIKHKWIFLFTSFQWERISQGKHSCSSDWKTPFLPSFPLSHLISSSPPLSFTKLWLHFWPVGLLFHHRPPLHLPALFRLCVSLPLLHRTSLAGFFLCFFHYCVLSFSRPLFHLFAQFLARLPLLLVFINPSQSAIGSRPTECRLFYPFTLYEALLSIQNEHEKTNLGEENQHKQSKIK